MLLILKTVDRVCGDVRKLVVFVRFPVAVGTRSGYLGDNVTDNLYLGLVVGGILDAVTQAVKVIVRAGLWPCQESISDNFYCTNTDQSFRIM